ncbi:hypothetical protein PDIG_55620 [Penicillium digitatum PHI26]|uniref:Uncharacterized protein n=1 Tax=Penicillium digitatum (strain PHI26 / CECT 20796) TaxID=1170229 RepID=K9FND0_PEND2|nr:hypothetical protein PDIG_55620 [Penicillium digitatum PHI26]
MDLFGFVHYHSPLWRILHQDYGNWSPQTFVSSCFYIPLFFVYCFGYKFWRKTRLVLLDEIQIQQFLRIANDNPEPIHLQLLDSKD